MKKIDIEKLHGNIMKRSFDLALINREAKENLETLVQTSEKLYTSQIDHIVKELVLGKQRIILLAGPSSAGKTTTSHLIRTKLKENGIDSIVISLDDFFVNRDRTPKLPDGSYDFECLEAIDLDYLNRFVDELLKTNKSKMPEFDFMTGSRKPQLKNLEITKDTVIIFEGIHALNPNLIKNHDEDIYKIYICINSNFIIGKDVVIPAKKLRQMRRLNRDYHFRGHSLSSTFKLWNNVCRGEDENIKPYKTTASYILDSAHMYEPLLYATYLAPLLKQEESEEAQELYSMLVQCGKLKNDIVPEGSLLWEFLKKD